MRFRRLLALALGPLLSAGLWLLPAPAARAQILYDASSAALPESPVWSWTYGELNLVPPFTAPVELLTNSSVLLDTTAANSISAGWSKVAAPDLNRTNGFSVVFNVQINAEVHSSTNRAGFSVIVLGTDTNGIELGFWTNTVFAQSTTPALFTHGEETSYPTTAAFVNYAVTISGTNYFLSASGTNILSGPLRNYSAFTGIINPYVIPREIFFGDDTTSAAGSFNVRSVALVLPPVLAMPLPGVVSWTGVGNQAYTVQSSTNLMGGWSLVGTVTSATSSFGFTNGTTLPAQFYRVTFP